MRRCSERLSFVAAALGVACLSFAPLGAAAAPPAGPLAHKTVLHTGDSTVGPANGGLTKALGDRFRAAGARFFTDHVDSASIAGFDRSPHLHDVLARVRPDVVVVTLGANDVFVPHPKALAQNIEAIARRIAPRECWWIGPPTWKPDTGIVDVLRDHSAPCKFFDSSLLPIERMRDGVHPTDHGGDDWAARFWAFYTAGGRAAAAAVPAPPAL